MNLKELVSTIEESRDSGDAVESIMRESSESFMDFAKGQGLSDLIHERMRSAMDDRGIDFGSGSDREIVLHRSAGFHISLSLHEGTTTYLSSSPVSGLICLLGETRVDYEKYSLPEDWDNAVFDPDIVLRPFESGSKDPYSPMEIDGKRFVYSFDFEGTGLALKLLFPIAASLIWTFDRERLQAIDVEAADADSDNLIHTADVLSEFDSASSETAFEVMSRHPSYFVRWRAIQGLARLNTEKGIEKLKSALADPHPHVRKAASSALSALSR